MPQLLAILPTIFAGVGAGTALGSTIYSAVKTPSTPAMTTPPNPASLLNQSPTQNTAAPQQVYNANANTQADTGGSTGLSPQAQASLLDLISSGGGGGSVNFGGATA